MPTRLCAAGTHYSCGVCYVQAFPADPKRCNFSVTTAFIASFADDITWMRSFPDFLRDSRQLFRTSVFTLNFLTPKSMHSCSRNKYMIIGICTISSTIAIGSVWNRDSVHTLHVQAKMYCKYYNLKSTSQNMFTGLQWENNCSVQIIRLFSWLMPNYMFKYHVEPHAETLC